MFIAIPSFALLYSTSTFCSPELTLKCIGHQWYWSYEITDAPADSEELFKEKRFDSYMLTENKAKNSEFPRNNVSYKTPRSWCMNAMSLDDGYKIIVIKIRNRYMEKSILI